MIDWYEIETALIENNWRAAADIVCAPDNYSEANVQRLFETLADTLGMSRDTMTSVLLAKVMKIQ